MNWNSAQLDAWASQAIPGSPHFTFNQLTGFDTRFEDNWQQRVADLKSALYREAYRNPYEDVARRQILGFELLNRAFPGIGPSGANTPEAGFLDQAQQVRVYGYATPDPYGATLDNNPASPKPMLIGAAILAAAILLGGKK